MLSAFWTGFLKSLETNKKKIPVLYSLLKQLKPIELSENRIILGCHNQAFKFFLEKKVSEIELTLSAFTHKKMSVELVVIPSKKIPKEAPLLSFQPSLEDVFYQAGLHAKYSFENFAVSTTNQVAFAAAQAVADNPGHSYNPLLFYGGVGVGKTHLAQSVARKVLQKDTSKKVFFCPGDQFTNELIEGIREKSTPRFRRKYRKLSLFIVDDVQFIAGKQTVQEEFFHTFNSVVSAGGQIILTSDRPPSEIKNLEDRLRSRFSGGLIVDIQPPDFELRTAILLIKAREKNIEIDIDAAKIIAEQITDTRGLEGTLLSLYAKILGQKEKIDLEAVDLFFSQRQKTNSFRVLPQDVIKTVCSYYNVKQSHLRGPVRNESIVLPRQIVMYILRSHLKLKLEEIAFLLKRKDHTTVIHAVDKMSGLIIKNPTIKQEIDGIITSLGLST
ncbi:chromosomal replication initiator protein DnaA [Candidatus Roizmanbacteria bacterium]|nr:chromosomal replication initiator protein DnaA [Candidatus Roizmanbacteria bacterium]